MSRRGYGRGTVIPVERDKYLKSEVNYQSPAEGMDECRDCEHYQVPLRCTKVQGMILPDAWCKLWEPKEDD